MTRGTVEAARCLGRRGARLFTGRGFFLFPRSNFFPLQPAIARRRTRRLTTLYEALPLLTAGRHGFGGDAPAAGAMASFLGGAEWQRLTHVCYAPLPRTAGSFSATARCSSTTLLATASVSG